MRFDRLTRRSPGRALRLWVESGRTGCGCCCCGGALQRRIPLARTFRPADPSCRRSSLHCFVLIDLLPASRASLTFFHCWRKGAAQPNFVRLEIKAGRQKERRGGRDRSRKRLFLGWLLTPRVLRFCSPKTPQKHPQVKLSLCPPGHSGSSLPSFLPLPPSHSLAFSGPSPYRSCFSRLLCQKLRIVSRESFHLCIDRVCFCYY